MTMPDTATRVTSSRDEFGLCLSPRVVMARPFVPDAEVPNFDLSAKDAGEAGLQATKPGAAAGWIGKLAATERFKPLVLSSAKIKACGQQAQALKDDPAFAHMRIEFRSTNQEPEWRHVPDGALFLTTSLEKAKEAARNGIVAGSVHGGWNASDADGCGVGTDIDNCGLGAETDDFYRANKDKEFEVVEKNEEDNAHNPIGKGPILDCFLKPYFEFMVKTKPGFYSLRAISARTPRMRERAVNSFEHHGVPISATDVLCASWDANTKRKPEYEGDVFFDDRDKPIAYRAALGRLAILIHAAADIAHEPRA